MASGPITSWQINGETVETVTGFIFLGSKITADGDCSHEIKRRLLLGRKAMTNLDSILKSRDITLPTKVHLVKAMVFPVALYGCESWTVKKAECWRIDAFELWCWRRFLRVPWTAAYQAPPPMGFSRQEYWSELPLPSPHKEQASFNIMAAVTNCNDFGAPKNKVCHCLCCFPIYFPWNDGTGCHDLCFLNVEL